MENKTSNGMKENMNENDSISNNMEMDSSPKKRSNKLKKIIIIIVAVLAVLTVIYYFDLIGVVKGNKTVAIVNDDKITRLEVDKRFEQITAIAKEQGVNIDDSDAVATRLRILDELITTKLLAQAAKEAGIESSIDAAQKEIQFIIDQLGDEKIYKEQLDQANISEEEFKNDVAQQLAIQEYISQNVDLESINVTDEEIYAFYEQISAGQENIPPFEIVSSQIASQLLSNKQQEAVEAFVVTLRDNADVETSL